MKLFIDKELELQSFNDFLQSNLDKLYSFANSHREVIATHGAYVKLDKYAICFSTVGYGEIELYVVGAQDKKINGKISFEELIEDTYPSPFEYEWNDIENIRIER